MTNPPVDSELVNLRPISCCTLCFSLGLVTDNLSQKLFVGLSAMLHEAWL